VSPEIVRKKRSKTPQEQELEQKLKALEKDLKYEKLSAA
jgi:hypothetical protein